MYTTERLIINNINRLVEFLPIVNIRDHMHMYQFDITGKDGMLWYIYLYKVITHIDSPIVRMAVGNTKYKNVPAKTIYIKDIHDIHSFVEILKEFISELDEIDTFTQYRLWQKDVLQIININKIKIYSHPYVFPIHKIDVDDETYDFFIHPYGDKDRLYTIRLYRYIDFKRKDVHVVKISHTDSKNRGKKYSPTVIIHFSTHQLRSPDVFLRTVYSEITSMEDHLKVIYNKEKIW